MRYLILFVLFLGFSTGAIAIGGKVSTEAWGSRVCDFGGGNWMGCWVSGVTCGETIGSSCSYTGMTGTTTATNWPLKSAEK